MKKKHWIALCAILLVVGLSFMACAAAPARMQSANMALAGGYESAAAPAAAPMLERGAVYDMEMTAAEAQLINSMADSVHFEADMLAAADANINFSPGDERAEVPPAQNAFAGRMIVTTFHLQAETMDFDGSISTLTDLVGEFGGYIESSSVSGRSIRFDDHNARWASFSVRIPSNRIHEFVAVFGEQTNIVSTSEHADDITEHYFDNQARLASLINQENLLSGLLETEGAGLEYILEVHRELANVRHQIEVLHAALQRMDQSVNFSTAHINLEEVMQYRQVDDLPTSFGQRVGQAFSNGWTNFIRQAQNNAVHIVWQLPFYLVNLLTFAFWVGVFWLVRRVIRKKKGLQRGERTFAWMRIGQIAHPKRSETPPQAGKDQKD